MATNRSSRPARRRPHHVEKKEEASSKVTTFLAAAFATSIIAAGVTYYAPGLWSSLRRDKSPITINVDIDPNISAGVPAETYPGTYVVPLRASQLGQPPLIASACGRTLYNFAVGIGGAGAMMTNLRLTIQSQEESSVVLTVRIKVLERHPIQRGTYLGCGHSGGDFAVARDVRASLDEQVPKLHYFVLDREVKSPFILSIKRGDAEIIDLHATASNGLYVWEAEVEMVIEGRRQVIPVTNNGQPFRTSGVVKGSKLIYGPGSDSRWESVPWKE